MRDWKLTAAVLCVVALLGSARGVEADAIDFPELVKLAKRYGLPRAPKNAPLVLANTGWTTVIGNSSTSRDPGIYRPAFLIKQLPNGQARVLMGWTERVVDSSAEHIPATRPYSLAPPEKKLKGYVLASNNMTSFVTAVQLAQRGELGKAGKLWKQVSEAEYLDDGNPHEGVGRWTMKPRVLLGRCLYQHFYHAVLREDAELKAIHRKLVQLKREFPVLFSDDVDRYYPHRKTRFVHDLGLTVSVKKAPKDSVESLLIDWGNRSGDMRHLGYFDPNNVDSNRSARAIFSKGVKAIPELVKLSNDRRLTRHISSAIHNKPEERVRLGELAKRLLEEMTGSQDRAVGADIPKQESAERAYFEKVAIVLKNGKISNFREVPLWILGRKYPKSLIEISSKIPTRALPDVPLFTLSEVVARSKLTQQEKAEALAGVCNRLKSFARKRAVLQQLAKVDEERCAAFVQTVLTKLPRDVDEPYWTSEAASYTHVVMQLKQDRVWKQYLRIAKRAAVGLRMEMMGPMNYSYIGVKNRKRRLAFLAAFLNDTTLRDSSGETKRYEGPHAGFTFKKLSVQNFVSMKIASILELRERPTEFWTQQQWTRLRKKVRTALKKEKLPTLAD